MRPLKQVKIIMTVQQLQFGQKYNSNSPLERGDIAKQCRGVLDVNCQSLRDFVLAHGFIRGKKSVNDALFRFNPTTEVVGCTNSRLAAPIADVSCPFRGWHDVTRIA